MSNIIKLTKILFKTTNFEISTSNSQKKKSSTIGKVLLGLLMLYSFGVIALMFFFLSGQVIEVFTVYHLESLGLEVLLLIVSAIIFFFAIFMIPTVFYFSDDVQALLPLPLKPYQIFASKFLVTLIYEYATTALVFIPMLAAYAIKVEVGFLFYVQAFVQLLLTPIIPMVLAMLLIMVLMRFSKIMRNRDRFNMIVGVIYIVACLGISLTASSIDPEAADRLILSLIENKSTIGIISKIIPSIAFAVKGMVNNDIISFIVSIVIPLGIAYIVIMLSNILYFKGVIGVNDSSSKRKKLSESYINKSLSSKGVVWTYTKKEIALLFRTPTYFMNCIISNFMWFIMGGIFYVTFTFSSDPEIDNLIATLKVAMQDIKFDYYQINLMITALGVSIGVGLLTSCLNSIASTAISREGASFTFMKYIPVSYRKQLDAKALSSIIITSMGSLPMLFIVAWFIKLPIIYYLIAIIGSTIGCIFLGYLGLLIDVLHPKLLWDSEKVAVKNNLNSLLVMMLTISFIVSFVFLLFKLNIDYTVGISVFIAVIVVFSIVLYVMIEKVAIKKFALL